MQLDTIFQPSSASHCHNPVFRLILLLSSLLFFSGTKSFARTNLVLFCFQFLFRKRQRSSFSSERRWYHAGLPTDKKYCITFPVLASSIDWWTPSNENWEYGRYRPHLVLNVWYLKHKSWYLFKCWSFLWHHLFKCYFCLVVIFYRFI